MVQTWRALVSQPVSTPHSHWLKLLHLDGRLCHRLNRLNHSEGPGRFFAAVSRLGDGVFWYALMLLLPLTLGRPGLLVSLHLLFTGACCLMVYRWIKQSTSRPRPFRTMPEIVHRIAPLDEFSFPSGHTLHAVAFTLVLASYLPTLAWMVLPFTLLVAFSRPVLGLHYPSDVLAGAIIGAAIATLTVMAAGWLWF
jgi:undecaprenyl-diphosphatase